MTKSISAYQNQAAGEPLRSYFVLLIQSSEQRCGVLMILDKFYRFAQNL